MLMPFARVSGGSITYPPLEEEDEHHTTSTGEKR
jgi:hypothetical protein